MRKLWERFLTILYPEDRGCLVCGAPSADDCCPTCKKRLRRNGPAICSFCGRTTQGDTLCSVCSAYEFPHRLTGCVILYRYEGLMRDVILRMKFHGDRRAAEALACLAAEEIARWEVKPDVLVPVPSHFLRTLMRGFAPVTLMAILISQKTGIPCETKALYRKWHGRAMTRISREKRYAHVRHAYEAGKVSLVGKHVLLVDDVCTSGATLSVCAGIMARAASVSALIVAGPADRELEEAAQL